MAIKISGNTVIDDSRQFLPVTILAGSTVGTAGSVLTSTGSGLSWTAKQEVISFDTITYSASINLDMLTLDQKYRTISLTGNLTFTSSNRAIGRMVSLRLICDGTNRNLTFPAGWVFIGDKPSSISSSKSAVLSITFYGTSDNDCIAAYSVQFGYSLDYWFPPTPYSYFENVRAVNYGSQTDTLTTPTGTYPGGDAFIGGVLLPDGRVFCVPHASTSALIYDPATDTLTIPTGTYPGSSAFNGGVLLPDGRVFCVPHDSTSARIYDPVTDTLITPTGTYPGSNAFNGGVLLPDGRVFCVPHISTSARIYDPATDTLITPTGTYPGSGAFVGGVLLPDGRVFCVPFNSTSARIYDPETDTLTIPTGTYPGGGAFVGGVLLYQPWLLSVTDGRVFCVPYNSTSARIYNPETNTLIPTTGTYPGSNAFVGGVLLPDGRVFCVPHVSTSARIYDPATNTLITPTGTYPDIIAFAGGVLLPDGRVFCVPFNSTSARIYGGGLAKNLPNARTLSAYDNKF